MCKIQEKKGIVEKYPTVERPAAKPEVGPNGPWFKSRRGNFAPRPFEPRNESKSPLYSLQNGVNLHIFVL